MISYWEQQSLLYYDYIIVGAGIVGISAALELRAAAPRATILVLERGTLPTGASTRNAGFACMGGLSELIDDLKHMPQEEVLRLFALRKEGLALLRKRLGDATIDYREEGSHELIAPHEKELLSRLNELNEMLKPITCFRVFTQLPGGKIEAFGLDRNHWCDMVAIRGEGMLHSGKMMRALITLAIDENVEIKTGCRVTRIDDLQNKGIVYVQDELRKTILPFEAKQVLVCTNAFAAELLPEVAMTPGRGQVIVTSKIKDLQLKGIYHYDKGYYYFRELEGRVLLGGARNMAFEAETTTTFAPNQIILQHLEHQLRAHIIPQHDFKIEYTWSGIMAFGPSKFPIIERRSPSVVAAYRMGGMGVALGSKVAQQLVRLVAP